MGVILVHDRYKQGNTMFTQNVRVNNGKVATIAKVLKVREMNTRKILFSFNLRHSPKQIEVIFFSCKSLQYYLSNKDQEYC